MAKNSDDATPQTPGEGLANVLDCAAIIAAKEDYDQFCVDQAESVWRYDSLDFNLTAEEQLFVRSYAIDRNGLAAMKRIGQSSTDQNLRSRAAKHLRNPEVSAAVDFLAKRMMEKLDVTAEKVQRIIAGVATFDPREVMEWDGHRVTLVNSRFWTAEQAAAVQTIKMGQNGIELKMYDRLRAAEMLSKQLGLQKDDNDPNEVIRTAANIAMDRMAIVFDRLLPQSELKMATMIEAESKVIE